MSFHTPDRATPARFNPRPRMGSDFYQPSELLTMTVEVSIHAPAWGATNAPATGLADGADLFQSTPPHGERRQANMDMSRPGWLVFQSTPPHGERRHFRAALFRIFSCEVSIHAPAWGATEFLQGQGVHGRSYLFQSTPPHGERRRLRRSHGPQRPTEFQSTPPHGERQATERPIEPSCKDCFNPRPRMGSDPISVVVSMPWDEFQSTPPHGERPCQRVEGLYSPPRAMFQSTPPHGERLCQANTLCGNRKKTG